MQAQKKRSNIYCNKRGNEGTENWVLSDMGSDTLSLGRESL